jgi:hypothetical protein
MQNPVLAEVIPEVLADGHHALEPAAVDYVNIREPALRPIRTNDLASKRGRMTLGPAMDLISLRHRPRLPPDKADRRSTSRRSLIL